MRVLVVTSSYPRGRDDVAGRFVREWVDCLEARGHELRVLCWRDGRTDDPESLDQRVRRVPYAPPRLETLFYGAGAPENLREQPARALLAAPAAAAMLGVLARELAVFRPDLVVGHWLVPSGLLVRLAGRIAGVPHLIVGHSGGVHLLDALPEWPGRALARIVLSGPVTLPSLELADKLGALAPKAARGQIEILPMGFTAPEVTPGSSSARRDWLCMGRHVEIKGVDLAIEAFARADLGPNVTLHVAGDGPRRAELERLAERTGAHAQFHGFVTGEDKHRLFERCGFALFCSKRLDDGRHEGLPVSFLEASACGVIPLTSNIPGLAAYLADPDRQELQTRSVAEWSERIVEFTALAADERARLATAQREAVAPLEWGRLGARWEVALERARSQ
ncbi:MAG: glycosyltransferase family 4 protein [Persicimonas sp.]